MNRGAVIDDGSGIEIDHFVMRSFNLDLRDIDLNCGIGELLVEEDLGSDLHGRFWFGLSWGRILGLVIGDGFLLGLFRGERQRVVGRQFEGVFRPDAFARGLFVRFRATLPTPFSELLQQRVRWAQGAESLEDPSRVIDVANIFPEHDTRILEHGDGDLLHGSTVECTLGLHDDFFGCVRRTIEVGEHVERVFEGWIVLQSELEIVGRSLAVFESYSPPAPDTQCSDCRGFDIRSAEDDIVVNRFDLLPSITCL